MCVPEGYGEMRLSAGEDSRLIYKGNWKAGEFSGHGRYFFADGSFLAVVSLL